MIRIKYNAELIKFISFFESLTKAKVKDCFFDNKNQLVFIVSPGQKGKVIGKNGSNLKRIENALNRKIKIVEFNPNIVLFSANLIQPLKLKEISYTLGILTLFGGDIKIKGLLIGRDSRNLKNYEEIIKRYFDIKGIKVI